MSAARIVPFVVVGVLLVLRLTGRLPSLRSRLKSSDRPASARRSVTSRCACAETCVISQLGLAASRTGVASSPEVMRAIHASGPCEQS